jgi:hypothetical protein
VKPLRERYVRIDLDNEGFQSKGLGFRVWGLGHADMSAHTIHTHTKTRPMLHIHAHAIMCIHMHTQCTHNCRGVRRRVTSNATVLFNDSPGQHRGGERERVGGREGERALEGGRERERERKRERDLRECRRPFQ